MAAATYVVPTGLAGDRFDRAVALLAGTSRDEAKRLVSSGDARINGETAAPSVRVAAGDRLTVELPAAEPVMVPEPVAYSVAYEDAAVVVVDKPAGVVVHPGAGNRTGTLAAGLAYRFPDLADLGEERRWGIVHRLDRETSGLLIVARTAPVHSVLQDAMRRRAVTRTYLTLVKGVAAHATATVDAPMGRDPRHPTRRAVVRNGRRARTHLRRVASWSEQSHSLLEVTLETGRTHQIRVHLASIGLPVVGDRTYGRSASAGVDPGRVWLHAARLRFHHPVDGRAVDVSSPLPPDLVASLRTLGTPSTGAVPAC